VGGGATSHDDTSTRARRTRQGTLKDGIVDESKRALEALSPSTNKVEGQLEEVLEEYHFHEDIRAVMTNEGDGFIERVMTILQAAKMNQRDLSTTKGRLGKLKMKLEAEHHHRANMTAAKTSYQHSVSERNKLMMGKIQNESNDMRVRMQTMLLGSAPESAKAAKQQQQIPQSAPMQEGFVEVEESETKDAEMKETCATPPRQQDARTSEHRTSHLQLLKGQKQGQPKLHHQLKETKRPRKHPPTKRREGKHMRTCP
jgi:hypothetical protein